VSPYSCFGQPLKTREVVFLMLCGLATAALHVGTLLVREYF
jgi:hypothetical protein